MAAHESPRTTTLSDRISTGMRENQIIDNKAAFGRRQGQAGRAPLRAVEELLQTPVGGARVGDLLPAADRLLDRLESPAQNDRTRNHGSARQFMPDDQPGAQRQNGDLNHLA